VRILCKEGSAKPSVEPCVHTRWPELQTVKGKAGPPCAGGCKGRARTDGPQSRAQPSLMGTSCTVTFGASANALRASSADCMPADAGIRN